MLCFEALSIISLNIFLISLVKGEESQGILEMPIKY